MKTPEEITIWCDMMLNRHPNIEDTNFFNSIKDYMKEQRPQGEWKLHGMIYYCSECGHDYEQGGNNFCGNCGARMKGSDR